MKAGVKGINVSNISGNVTGDVFFAQTGRGEDACSFRLAISQAYKSTTFVRVNVYGGHVSVCRSRDLSRGDYCVVSGELMNRKVRGELLTEIRCLEIVINPSGEKREYSDEEDE